MPLDLRFYLEQFPAVCQSKFGRRYHLEALEKSLAVVRDAKRPLTARDVAKIFNPEASPFAKYWPRPHTKVLEEALKKNRLKLGPLPSHPEDLLRRMLAVFQNMGTVSLILQFVYPERFAIFSTPIIHLVHVTRPGLLELYIAYCDELRVWTDHFRMPSVAATSTALWTYFELTKETAEDPGAARAREEFDNDIWIQRRIVSHFLRPFLRRYGGLELAYILSQEDPRIAGKIAAGEYERLLNHASLRMYGSDCAGKRELPVTCSPILLPGVSSILRTCLTFSMCGNYETEWFILMTVQSCRKRSNAWWRRLNEYAYLGRNLRSVSSPAIFNVSPQLPAHCACNEGR